MMSAYFINLLIFFIVIIIIERGIMPRNGLDGFSIYSLFMDISNSSQFRILRTTFVGTI